MSYIQSILLLANKNIYWFNIDWTFVCCVAAQSALFKAEQFFPSVVGGADARSVHSVALQRKMAHYPHSSFCITIFWLLSLHRTEANCMKLKIVHIDLVHCFSLIKGWPCWTSVSLRKMVKPVWELRSTWSTWGVLMRICELICGLPLVWGHLSLMWTFTKIYWRIKRLVTAQLKALETNVVSSILQRKVKPHLQTWQKNFKQSLMNCSLFVFHIPYLGSLTLRGDSICNLSHAPQKFIHFHWLAPKKNSQRKYIMHK